MIVKIVVGGVCAGVFVPFFASAQVVVSEIMYDLKSGADGGHEWIEVYNAGSADLPLGNFRLFENGTAHKITAVSGGSVLHAGGYAVIADNATNFKSDWPHYGGALFDSAFSLSNSGETIVLRNASSTDLDSATYESSMGAAGDGNSLNRSNGGAAFVARAPSPGLAMSNEVIEPPAPPKAPEKTVKVPTTKKSTVPTKVVAEPDSLEPSSFAEVATETTPVSEVEGNTVVTNSAPRNSSLWWIGALVIAAFAASSLLLARRLSKTEWDIEEMEETG